MGYSLLTEISKVMPSHDKGIFQVLQQFYSLPFLVCVKKIPSLSSVLCSCYKRVSFLISKPSALLTAIFHCTVFSCQFHLCVLKTNRSLLRFGVRYSGILYLLEALSQSPDEAIKGVSCSRSL